MELVVERPTRSQPAAPAPRSSRVRLDRDVEAAKAGLRATRLFYDDLSAEVAFATERVRQAVAAASRAS
jgi:hypothetical protein